MRGDIGRLLVSAAGLVTLALLLGASARAGTPEDTMTVTRAVQRAQMQEQCPVRRTTVRGCVTHATPVRYGDLDLASRGGAETLYRRLQIAANTVCGVYERQYVQYVELRRERRQCVDTTLDNAVVATGIEHVVAMHREATGRDVSRASQLAGAP